MNFVIKPSCRVQRWIYAREGRNEPSAVLARYISAWNSRYPFLLGSEKQRSEKNTRVATAITLKTEHWKNVGFEVQHICSRK